MGFQTPAPLPAPSNSNSNSSAFEQALEIQMFQLTEDVSQNKVRKTWDQVVEAMGDDENDPDTPPKVST